MRSAYFAQELLTTFEDELGEVALSPNLEKTGTFKITIEDRGMLPSLLFQYEFFVGQKKKALDADDRFYFF
jgi:hypothetical protein